MRNILRYLFPLVLVFAIVSCRGKDGKDGLVNSKIIDLQIDQKEWRYTNAGSNNYFFATFDVPELTWNIYNYGVVKIYREWDTGTDRATQVELPYIKMNEYSFNDTDTTTVWDFYQEMVDYEYTGGAVTIFYTVSDFAYEIDEKFMPDPMHFRLIMMW